MKKSIARILALVLALMMVLVIVACNKDNSTPGSSAPAPESSAPAPESSAPAAAPSASTAPQDKITVRIGTTGARGHIMTEWMYQFIDAIEAKTDKFVVEPYPSSQFGTTNEMIEALLSNNLQAMGVPTPYYASFCPFVNILDVPYLFPDNETCFEFMNTHPEVVVKAFQEVGLFPVCWPYVTTHWIDSTVPIRSFADLKGLNIRGNNSDVWYEIYDAMGANAVVIATADLPMALQQGTVDCHVGPFSMLYSLLMGIVKYDVQIPNVPTMDVFMFNDEFLQSMSEADRTLFLDTCREVTMGINREMSIAMTEDFLKAFEEEGIEMTYMDDQMDADMRAAFMPIKERFPTTYPDLADDYYELTAAIEAFVNSK